MSSIVLIGTIDEPAKNQQVSAFDPTLTSPESLEEMAERIAAWRRDVWR